MRAAWGIVGETEAMCSDVVVDEIYEAKKFDGDSYYVIDEGNGLCIERAIHPDFEFYATGARISPEDTFVRLTYETDD
jgi:hypothetical protein